MCLLGFGSKAQAANHKYESDLLLGAPKKNCLAYNFDEKEIFPCILELIFFQEPSL